MCGECACEKETVKWFNVYSAYQTLDFQQSRLSNNTNTWWGSEERGSDQPATIWQVECMRSVVSVLKVKPLRWCVFHNDIEIRIKSHVHDGASLYQELQLNG